MSKGKLLLLCLISTISWEIKPLFPTSLFFPPPFPEMTH